MSLVIPAPTKYSDKGIVLIHAPWIDVDVREKCTIGIVPGCSIVLRKDQPTNLPDYECKHVTSVNSFKLVTFRCNHHQATLKIPSNIRHQVNVPLIKEWRKQPILSIFPVIYGALVLWQRAYSKTNMATEQVWCDSDSFDGIIPYVVAAAMRGTPVISYRNPKEGIQQNICELLGVEIFTQEMEQ